MKPIRLSKALFFLVHCCFVATFACSSSDAPTSTSLQPDAAPVATDVDASDDVAETGAPDAIPDAGHDAGKCAPCPSQFKCVLNTSGQPYAFNGKKDADGTCHFSSATLACGGTGLTASGKPLTWSAGPNVGPSGGPGIHIDFGDTSLNCE